MAYRSRWWRANAAELLRLYLRYLRADTGLANPEVYLLAR